ncbi:MAG: PP2C family protein-serine/threonine phosphatase [Ardenticatenaceae bacterium]
MLTELLARQEIQLAALADAWLAMGAEGFGVWADGKPFACWPEGISLEDATLIAPLELGIPNVCELRIIGLTATAQTRLDLDATLLSDLIRLEDELDTMTSEFIDIQDQLLAIYDLTKSTRTRLNREQTLELLACEAARLVKVEGAFLLLHEPQRPLLWTQDGTPQLTTEQMDAFLEMLPSISSHQQWDSRTQQVILPPGIDNLLLIPIQIRSGIAGMGLINTTNGNFSSPDIKLALTIADQAAAQIDLVLLHEETVAQTKFETEMQLAQSVQLNLLPKEPPVVDGLDLWADSRPALQVGGDFYDFIDDPGRPFIFAIGDVSGKGMPAAILMAMTRTVLRNGAKFANPPIPEEFMRRANEDLYNDFTEVSMFVTVFVGRYDADTRFMHYANAGHSPVIYCPAGGKASLLEADGPAMGVLPINLSENHTIRFDPGDLLVAGTDGFSEASNLDGEMFGYDRLLDLVETLTASGKSAEEVAKSLFKTIDDFSASHMQDDDQTLIVVRGVPSDLGSASKVKNRY